jgi:phospholipid-binding lipoprotein MlaA
MKGIYRVLLFSMLMVLLSPAFCPAGDLEGLTRGGAARPGSIRGVDHPGDLSPEGMGSPYAPVVCLNIRNEDLGRYDRQGAGGALRIARAEEETMGTDGAAPVSIADPLEPINRAFFYFNDKLYFWLLKPVARGYRAVTPQTLRICVKNFFYNLGFPVRFVNCIFQGKIRGAGNEITRFLANSTAGIGGLFDIATNNMKIKRYEEDLGQTFGTYGLGPGFYINWPILGPSSLRDTFGSVGDVFLDPLNYAVPHTKYRVSVNSYDTINKTSLSLGEYEDFKKAALDPYVALRDAYWQNRKSMISE